MPMTLFPARRISEFWCKCRDGDVAAHAIFCRHYSRRKYLDGRNPKKITGPGQYLMLITPEEDAVFAWRKFIDASGQNGINCCIFRNEGPNRSSDMIREADELAWQRWSEPRHYTYVNPKKIRSSNPGYCFIAAGWRKCGVTKKGLIILEIARRGLLTPPALAVSSLSVLHNSPKDRS